MWLSARTAASGECRPSVRANHRSIRAVVFYISLWTAVVTCFFEDRLEGMGIAYMSVYWTAFMLAFLCFEEAAGLHKLFLAWTMTLQESITQGWPWNALRIHRDHRHPGNLSMQWVSKWKWMYKNKQGQQSVSVCFLTSECFFLEDKSRVVSYKLSTKFLRQGTFTSFFTA